MASPSFIGYGGGTKLDIYPQRQNLAGTSGVPGCADQHKQDKSLGIGAYTQKARLSFSSQ
jgi:hypothetical protein